MSYSCEILFFQNIHAYPWKTFRYTKLGYYDAIMMSSCDACTTNQIMIDLDQKLLNFFTFLTIHENNSLL